METDRLQKRVEVHSIKMCDGMALDELRALINDAEKNYGAEFVETEEEYYYDRCGDRESEGFFLRFIKYVPETDDEYNARMERLRKEREKSLREKEEKERKEAEAAKKKIEAEQMKLLELMEKYPDIAKLNNNK